MVPDLAARRPIRLAADADLTAQRPALADERFDELPLAVAGDARDAEDLARPHRELQPANRRPSGVVFDDQVADDESRLGRPAPGSPPSHAPLRAPPGAGHHPRRP